jgi:hypothetical protein
MDSFSTSISSSHSKRNSKALLIKMVFPLREVNSYLRDALRLHEIYREKVITDLRNEIEKGWSSESSDRSIADIIAAKKAAYAKK